MSKSQLYVPGRGLDVGTSFIISARELKEGNKVQYTEMRDAFYKLRPASPIAKSMMEKGLKGQHYFVDTDNSFVVLGQDAIERAIERHDSASRPMSKGVLSPKEKNARLILRHIFKEVLGEPEVESEKVVYTIPAQPVDQSKDQFDIGWHQDAVNNDLVSLGFSPKAIYEAEAICYSELEEDGYTGIAGSHGSGMTNWCLMSAGEAILHWSTSLSGDWIDRMAASATGEPDTVVQMEKEQTKFLIGKETSNNPILSAVSLYYVRLIDYTVKHLVHQLLTSPKLPKFQEPIPIVLAGGTALADGFLDEFKKKLEFHTSSESESYLGKLPFEVKEVRIAKDSLRAIAKGCLLAASF